jgi:hypothetical protein
MNISPSEEKHPWCNSLNSKDLDAIAAKLNLQTDAAKIALGVVLDNITVFDKKQRDYGSQNISKFGELGVLVRMSDKLERLINLIQKKREASNESIEDSYLDSSNYGIIGYMVRKGWWK